MFIQLRVFIPSPLALHLQTWLTVNPVEVLKRHSGYKTHLCFTSYPMENDLFLLYAAVDIKDSSSRRMFIMCLERFF